MTSGTAERSRATRPRLSFMPASPCVASAVFLESPGLGQGRHSSTWSKPALWSMGLLEPSDWQGADWIGSDKSRKNVIAFPLRPICARPSKPRNRSGATTLYATALGIFDVHLNGQRVSDDYFNPGWTDYTKRVYYRAYDVTSQLRAGDNALGAILADGWYSGYVGFGKKRDHYGTKPRFRALLHLELADGSTAGHHHRPSLANRDWPDPRGRLLDGRGL